MLIRLFVITDIFPYINAIASHPVGSDRYTFKSRFLAIQHLMKNPGFFYVIALDN
ncbi:hypothetical protein D9M68_700030 [compost metagenome]